MADTDLLPSRGVTFEALVDSTGIAINGSSTVAQLAAKGMRAACAVDGTGTAITGGGSLAQLAASGIRAFCAVDQNGVAQDASTADQLRARGIRPRVLLDATGVALNGSAGQAVLASRGLQSFCPVDESGNATTMGAVILISNTNVFDNIAVGATVGTLSVAGGSGTYTFTLPSNPGAHFATAGTNGVNLNTATALTAGSYPVTVQAAGGVPTPISRALSITVAPFVVLHYSLTCNTGSFLLSGDGMTPISGYTTIAQKGTFLLGDPGTTQLKPPLAPYPGDLAGWGSAYGYWGLRAYKSTKIGANCIDVCANFTGAAVSLTTVVIGSNGYADLSSIGFSPIYVNRIYDQSGTQDLFFGASSGRATISTNMVGGKPAMLFASGPYAVSTSNAIAQAQPLTVAAIYRSNTWSSNTIVFSDGTNNFAPLLSNNVASIAQYFGVFIDGHPSVADNTFASLISVCNNASGSMSVNGTITPPGGAVGTAGIGTTNKLTIGANDSGGLITNGYIFEVIVKVGAVSPVDQAALTANQRAIGTGW